MKREVYYDYIDFDEYQYVIAVTKKGLAFLTNNGLEDVKIFYAKNKIDVTLLEDKEKVREYKKQLQEYFDGNRKEFELPLDFEEAGTELQRKVWRELMKVPFGEFSSYSLIAEKVNHPKAHRAVGTAVGKNPIPIVIPCHRIIRKDKGIGGYAGGIPLKLKLLEIEKSK